MITSEREMTILETAFKQRAFDGKWERIVKIMDTDNKIFLGVTDFDFESEKQKIEEEL